MGKLPIKSDLPNRDELERRLARALGREFGREFDELMDALGDPPDPNNLPPEFWEGKEMRGVLDELLAGTFIVAAEIYHLEFTVGFDWGLVNQDAIDWARGYTFDLVSGINNTTRGVLQSALETYYRDGLTKKELAQLLEPTYGPVRASMIARTETTRAAVEGQRAVDRRIEQGNPNIRMVPIWLTSNSDNVCEICAPKNNQPILDGIFPPAHPNCNCDYRSEMTVIE